MQRGEIHRLEMVSLKQPARELPDPSQMANTPVNPTGSANDEGYGDDTFTLTQEEEAVLSQIDEKHQAAQFVQASTMPGSPTTSPTRRKRKRPASSERSPHASPYKLRSSVKLSSRAVDAGLKPPNGARAAYQATFDSNAAAPDPTLPADLTTATSTHPPVSGPKDNGAKEAKGKERDCGLQASGQGHSRGQSRGLSSSDSGRCSEPIGPVCHSLPGGLNHLGGQSPLDAMNHVVSGQSSIQYQQYPYHGFLPHFAQPPPAFQFHNPAYQGHPSFPVEGINMTSNPFTLRYTTPDACEHSSGQIVAPNNQHPVTSREGSRQPSLVAPPAPAPQPTCSASSKLPPAPATPVQTRKLMSFGPKERELMIGELDKEKQPIGASDDEDVDEPGSPRNDSPTIGRLSDFSRNALRIGFEELDAIVKRTSIQTGLTPVQIVERWDAKKTRAVSSWNIYQGFFEERRDGELSRLPPEDCPTPGAVPDKAVISACYDAFKAANPDRYDDILRTWHRLRIVSVKGTMSISRRAREFKKHVEKMDNLIRHSSNLYGFETICLTVGGIVNQDQDIGSIIASDAANEFFLERLSMTDNLALAQIKIHVYDRLGRRMMVREGAQKSSTDSSTAPVTTGVKAKESTPAALGDTNILADLKERFIALAAKNGISITKGHSLHWKGLPQIVAEAGCVIVNWPEDVSFPCDSDPGGKNTSKGIAILKLPARLQLLGAFDHPTFPLRIEKRYTTAVPKDQPVIIGVPPDSASPHAFGRRKFLDDNQNEDRMGPPRCKPTSSSGKPGHTGRRSKASAHTANMMSEPSRSCDEVASSPDDDVPLALSDSSGSEDLRTPKALKKTAGKSAKVHFKAESPESPYSSSLDGSPKYSGLDEVSVPVVRSPLNLRSKSSARNVGKKKAALQTSGKSKAKNELLGSRSAGKKRAPELTIVQDQSPGPSAPASRPAPPSAGSSVAKDVAAADAVAQKLFGGGKGAHEPTPASVLVLDRKAGHSEDSAVQEALVSQPPQATTTPQLQPQQALAMRQTQQMMPPQMHQLHHPTHAPLGMMNGQQQHTHAMQHAAHPAPMHAPLGPINVQQQQQQQQQTLAMPNAAHSHPAPGYSEGYFPPSNYGAPSYSNGMQYGPASVGPLWYSHLPPSSSGSNTVSPGAGYTGHSAGSYWPGHVPPGMMYANTFHQYPPHMPPPQRDGKDEERSA